MGLPLATVNAVLGRPTLIYDVAEAAVRQVRKGQPPFRERGLDDLLVQALDSERLTRSTHPGRLGEARFVVLVGGTPVDKYLNPDVDSIFAALEPCLHYFRAGQTLILRSTVYPGMSEKLQEYLRDHALDVEVAFCPERIAEGRALQELRELPQIISAFSERGLAAARAFFAPIAPELMVLEPLEAELAKLFTNAYRYIEFATVNQFYMIAEAQGADYRRIERAVQRRYPRLARLPDPGFAAGPVCSRTRCSWRRFTTTSSRSDMQRSGSTKAYRTFS